RSDEVDLDGQLELLHRISLRGLRFLVASDGLRCVCYAGAIDQDPLLPVSRPCLLERSLHGVVGRYVDFAEDAADLARDLLATARIAVEHGNLRAALGQLPSRGFTKA